MILTLPAPGAAAAVPVPRVCVARVEHPITAVVADYLERSLEIAQRESAEALLIELDTPGGDLSSTQRIVSALLNSETPTIVWVGPSGAQAASAGTFIVLAAHAAGMAPQTTVGAASPVDSSGGDLPDTMSRKATEDMSALARGLAERRGEKVVEWADLAVREAASLSSEEALELGLIDALADDGRRLLEELDGMEVLVGGAAVELQTGSANTVEIPMTRGEGLLTVLIHPAVALLLITLGINAILIELSSPGGFIPGTIGVLALALGLYSLGVLNANLIGLVFLAAAFALFVLDLKAPTHGLLTAGGVVLFVVGAAILFSGNYYEVPWPTIFSLALGTGLFFAFAISAVVRTMRRQPTTGIEGLMGKTAVVREALDPVGTVLVWGELWHARSAEGESHEPGARVVVSGAEGHTLLVRSEAENSDSAEHS